mmetsp:Transcript_62497/g.174203  ORF Transcript_62497/g.174203 Transcript_62497/m.174203 type:complete len:503 (+) Transcript_62497:1287-2795(+)
MLSTVADAAASLNMRFLSIASFFASVGACLPLTVVNSVYMSAHLAAVSSSLAAMQANTLSLTTSTAALFAIVLTSNFLTSSFFIPFAAAMCSLTSASHSALVPVQDSRASRAACLAEASSILAISPFDGTLLPTSASWMAFFATVSLQSFLSSSLTAVATHLFILAARSRASALPATFFSSKSVTSVASLPDASAKSFLASALHVACLVASPFAQLLMAMSALSSMPLFTTSNTIASPTCAGSNPIEVAIACFTPPLLRHSFFASAFPAPTMHPSMASRAFLFASSMAALLRSPSVIVLLSTFKTLATTSFAPSLVKHALRAASSDATSTHSRIVLLALSKAAFRNAASTLASDTASPLKFSSLALIAVLQAAFALASSAAVVMHVLISSARASLAPSSTATFMTFASGSVASPDMSLNFASQFPAASPASRHNPMAFSAASWFACRSSEALGFSSPHSVNLASISVLQVARASLSLAASIMHFFNVPMIFRGMQSGLAPPS